MVRIYIVALANLLFSIESTNGVTIEEVQQHGSSSDCWSVIYDTVYDFTAYGSSHTFGGGPDRVWASCGVDYTDEFDQVHGDSLSYLQWDGIVEIGALTTPSGPPPTDATTPAQQTVAPTPAPTTPEPSPTTPEPATQTTQESLTSPGTTTQAPMPDTTTSPPKLTTTTSAMPDTTASPPKLTTTTSAIPDTTASPPKITTTTSAIPDTTASPPKITTTTSENALDSETTLPEISMDELSTHDNPESCWVLFYDQVYDLTEYAYRHPKVGEAAIHPYCGINGTDAFANVHEKSYLESIDDLNVGTLEATNSPGSSPTGPPQATVISDEEVAEHDTPEDCWVIFYESVYDMTKYALTHPGPGAEAIHPWCGLDGTTAFDAVHPESYLSKIQYTKVADLSTSSAPKMSISFIAALGLASFMAVH
jgi:cytochrome b involved in lipid metabolism